MPGAEKHFQGVDFICDDSFSGSVVARLTGALDRPVRILTRESFQDRVRDLRGLMQTDAPIGIALDTGGPYGRVDPALVRLAQRCRARLVPLVALTSRSIPFWHDPLLGLPLPGTVLTLAAGETVDAEGADVLGRAQSSLDLADTEARRQLDLGPSTSGA